MKKFFRSKNIYILVLLVLTLCAFPLALKEKGIVYSNKVSKTSSDKSGYNRYGYYEEDNYYDSDNYDDYNNYYGDDDYYDDYNDNYYYDNYNDYNDNYYTYGDSLVRKTNTTYSNETSLGVKYNSNPIVYVDDIYNLLSDITATDTYYGDVTNNIEVIYNGIIGETVSNNYIKVTTPGEFKVVYRVCNYSGSNNCKIITRNVSVKYKNSSSLSSKYGKEPIWKNTGDYSCISSNYNCNTYSIPAPTAKDPYSGRSLSVKLISGEIDQYKSGTYTLIYEAYTENNVRGIVYKNVLVNYKGNSNTDTVLPSSKYITGYYSEYYDDGLYSGYLKSDNRITNSTNKKFVDNYEWTNKVRYTYQCTIQGGSGVEGWAHLSTDNSDDHPTIEYSKNGYEGTLTKKSFYCKNGCSDKLVSELGTCTNLGETKQITRTWVGIYYGEVYSSFNNYFGQETYSGYVYLKR